LKFDMARARGGRTCRSISLLFPCVHARGGWYQGSRQGYRDRSKKQPSGDNRNHHQLPLMQFDESKKGPPPRTPIFPAQIHDAKAAVRWLRANARSTTRSRSDRGDGGSAGGHLSLLVGSLILRRIWRVTAAVQINPVACKRWSMFRADRHGILYGEKFGSLDLPFVHGRTPERLPNRYKVAVPSITSVRTIHLCSLFTAIRMLWCRSSRRKLGEKMKEVGASHTLMVFEGQGHGFSAE